MSDYKKYLNHTDVIINMIHEYIRDNCSDVIEIKSLRDIDDKLIITIGLKNESL